MKEGSGEMAQQFGALAALSEDHGSDSCHLHGGSQLLLNSRGSRPGGGGVHL